MGTTCDICHDAKVDIVNVEVKSNDLCHNHGQYFRIITRSIFPYYNLATLDPECTRLSAIRGKRCAAM
jgi:hypothetical protein